VEFRIADTFTDSLARLTNDEQKNVKTTAFDLQVNPANPGMQLHKVDKAKDPNFRSVRVNLDIRLIVHKSASSLLLCYVDHHKPAYRWAERRRLETHPKTGAAQLIEIRETVREIITPKYIESEQITSSKPPLFADIPEDDLLRYGVPGEWMDDVRAVNEDGVLDLADHLPSEAAEALLDLATGATPQIVQPVSDSTDPFEHPDAKRRFRLMQNVEELERALEYPWEKWTLFLHPTQQQMVERGYNGPARISGSAGTGKTIVALHRAVFLARTHPDSRVLLTTFSDTLANAIRLKLKRLIINTPHIGERVEVYAMNTIGLRLYELNLGLLKIASQELIQSLLEKASKTDNAQKFTLPFLITEWEQVVDAWQLETWEAYRDVLRLGRKTRLPEQHRLALWSIFEQVRSELQSMNRITCAQMFGKLTTHLNGDGRSPFDFALVDEAQDINVPQLRFLSALSKGRPNSLFFAGDLGQRIFQQPFSWKALGVDIRGRSRTLRINYRTSHQIRLQADRLLDPEISDVDGNAEERKGTISVFNGPKPKIEVLDTREEEIETLAQWLSGLKDEGLQPHEMGIFVRSPTELERAVAAVEKAGLPSKVLDENVETTTGYVSISTMHLAKGLEFRAVAVMACDDEVIPSQERIETISDDADLEEVYNTERHLLYVACTRARDYLMVTAVEPGSEFLDDLQI